jgi:hypothetical protein
MDNNPNVFVSKPVDCSIVDHHSMTEAMQQSLQGIWDFIWVGGGK